MRRAPLIAATIIAAFTTPRSKGGIGTTTGIYSDHSEWARIVGPLRLVDREGGRTLVAQHGGEMRAGLVLGSGTAELAEFLQVTFDVLAAPQPETKCGKDRRTPGQRRHDALLDALKITVGSGTLEKAGGVLATVVLTMTAETYATGDGFALTGHNALVPVKEALSWAGGDYRLMITALNSLKAVVAYSSSHRFFTEGQRLALIARDGGCSFPGCQAPPGWCQTHHVTESQDGGPTTIANGTLLCGYHHREFERRGWHVHMEHGRPVWTPPRIVDPDQTPIRT